MIAKDLNDVGVVITLFLFNSSMWTLQKSERSWRVIVDHNRLNETVNLMIALTVILC